MDAPEHDGDAGHDEDEKGCPVVKGECEGDDGEEAAGVARVTDETVGAGVDHAMAGVDGNVDGEKAAEIENRIPAQNDPENEQGTDGRSNDG